MWHRVAIADLLIAVTALHNDLGFVPVDGDHERIAEVHLSPNEDSGSDRLSQLLQPSWQIW